MISCFRCFINELENVIKIHLQDSTEPETRVHLKREDEEEMRTVSFPKSTGLNECQEAGGFSEFQISGIIVNPVIISKYLSNHREPE